jgi:hypothetical protein
MREDLVRTAGAVGDPAVKRLDPKPAERTAGYERVEAPPQAINLHDVTCLDAFQSHHLSA